MRHVPLQLFAQAHEGATIFICTKMGGEEGGRIEGFGPEDAGSALAVRIQESLPAPPNAHWKAVLPSGAFLEQDALTLTLRDLFELDVGEVEAEQAAAEALSDGQTAD